MWTIDLKYLDFYGEGKGQGYSKINILFVLSEPAPCVADGYRVDPTRLFLQGYESASEEDG